MGSSRLFATSIALLGVMLAFLLLVVWGLSGCGGQDVTIGEGDAELVFTNQGDVSVPITVRWTGENQRILTERFTVLTSGRVTLKLLPRLSYDIEMRPDCPDTSQAPTAESGLAQDQVIDLRWR